MPDETLVAAYRKGVLYSFVRSYEHTFSRFGGPLDWEMTGAKHGPAPLHQVARFGGEEINHLRGKDGSFYDVALLYGFRYSGCLLKYRLESGGKIKILELSPRKSTEDWPYVGFPQLLPFVPLKLGQKRRMKYSSFASMIPNLPDEQPAELMFAVRPAATIGVSMWGYWGDAEGVTLIYEMDTETQTFQVYDVCT